MIRNRFGDSGNAMAAGMAGGMGGGGMMGQGMMGGGGMPGMGAGMGSGMGNAMMGAGGMGMGNMGIAGMAGMAGMGGGGMGGMGGMGGTAAYGQEAANAAPFINEQGEYVLFVLFLPDNITDQDLFQLFALYGPVSSVLIPRDKQTGGVKGYAFVCMLNYKDAVNAIRYLNGHPVGNKRLKVSFKETQRRDGRSSSRAWRDGRRARGRRRSWTQRSRGRR